MAYPTLPPAAELCQRIGIFPGSILRATWYRYARSLHLDAGPEPARWTVQVEHDPALTRLLDLHPWEEVSTDRHTTWTVRLPELDLVWCIQHKPTRTVRRG